MTKAEAVAKMAEEAEITKSAAGIALDSFIDAVVKTVKKGDKLSIVGFGTFSRTSRKARTGRNPKTGETIRIKASKAPKFTAGKTFKDAVK